MMTKDAAEAVALEALAWLVGNDDLLPVFLGSTGASLDSLSQGARDPLFLGAVLDFLMLDDAWLLDFADHGGHKPELLMQARASLPGGELPHWT